ncbi:FAD-dependent oxidoreductase [Caproiciproducens sp.]
MEKQIEQILKMIQSDGRFTACSVKVTLSADSILTLTGTADTWENVVNLGHLTASVPGVVNVVNDLTVANIHPYRPDNRRRIAEAREIGVIGETDVLIVGGGISGCGIARELSKYDLRVAVVEKDSDVSEEATKANNGDIHPGHKVKPGTLKAKLNARGNFLYTKWQEELGFEMVRCGQTSVAYCEEDMKKLRQTYEDGLQNQVPGLRLLTREEVIEKEPGLAAEPVAGGLNAPTMAVVEPFRVCVALAENAVQNGVKFLLSTELLAIDRQEGHVAAAVTERGIIRAKYIINCAGVHADDVAEMAGDRFFTIHPRRGGILLFDRQVSSPFRGTVSSMPKEKNKDSKGGGFSATPEKNILIGPSAVEVWDKDAKSMEAEDFEYAFQCGKSVYPSLKKQDIIAMYVGIRPADYTEDFIIGLSRKVGGFINVAGIQSPGLASAPAIAEMVIGILKDDGLVLEQKPGYQPYRKEPVQFRRLSREQQAELIKKEPSYGHIICRCEQITEGEILEVLQSPLIPTTVDAIKRRTRAGMGRCQGGFCQPRVVEILARELGKSWTDVNLKGRNGYILAQDNREGDKAICKP